MFEDAGVRLREERERLRLSQSEAAKAGNVSKNTQAAYEKGATPITLPYLEAIRAAGFDAAYVTLGKRTADEKLSQADTVPIRVLDLAYGMGGAFIDEHAEEAIEPFPRSVIAAFTKAPAEKLRLVRGIGDSMMPTINDGDLVLIDLSQDAMRMNDQIWALATGDIGMIKRLRVAGGALQAISDNPNVTDFTIAEDDCRIVGRVVACLRSL